jgi:RND family efflux transporter MFP subunit
MRRRCARIGEDLIRPLVLRLLLSFALAAGLAACEREAPTVPEQVRAIRAFTVTDAANGQVRSFSGVIEASETSALSFQVGGNVHEVRVNQGDTVRAQQVLAILDTEPYRLNVQAAEAELARARADLAQARSDYERHQRLIAQRAVSQVQFEAARRNFQSAESQVDLATAKLNLARRDLRNTTLVAPFDGTIAERLVDPFVEVRAGQTVFRINASGGMQASIGVPETAIDQLVLGMPATVAVPQLPQPMEAHVSEIGTAAGTGNLFPVKAALDDPPPSIRAGMTAAVILRLPQNEAAASYFVPLAAIAPGDRSGEGFVFVYDPQTSTVRRTPIRSAGPLIGNMVAVTGVSAGDVVASAGVVFLVDGQKVKLMEPASTPSNG